MPPMRSTRGVQFASQRALAMSRDAGGGAIGLGGSGNGGGGGPRRLHGTHGVPHTAFPSSMSGIRIRKGAEPTPSPHPAPVKPCAAHPALRGHAAARCGVPLAA
eukprot:12169-Chlamydomonas_euryale.AAC.9